MLRGFVKRVQGLLGKQSSAAGVVANTSKPSTIVTPTAPPTNIDSESHQILRDAVRELSKGQSIRVSSSPVTLLRQWNVLPVKELETDQLLELARVHFEGLGDDIIKDEARAVELWTSAKERGSVEAAYSRAVCIRDGVGTSQDPTQAFRELQELADNEDYNLAHVCFTSFLSFCSYALLEVRLLTIVNIFSMISLQYAVALMLSSGEAIPRDDDIAFQYFKVRVRLPYDHNNLHRSLIKFTLITNILHSELPREVSNLHYIT